MRAPNWLSKVAKDYYKAIAPQLDDMSPAQQSQLALLCDGLATLREASQLVEKEGLICNNGGYHPAILIKQKANSQITNAYKALGLDKRKDPTSVDELEDFFAV